MRIPTVQGVIDRRILVNYRVDPDVLQGVLPSPFRPQLVRGYGIAGICLIRLKQLRPRRLPRFVGVGSENAAHRIAVEWDDDGTTRTGVYIPRRDTSSWFNYLAGGRLFPGVHHRARFSVEENDGRYRVGVDAPDGGGRLAVDGQATTSWIDESVFESIDEASMFFEQGAVGYSPSNKVGCFDGLELNSFNWRVEPLAMRHVASSFFSDQSRFPTGSVSFDCALLMRQIHHEWYERATIRAG